MSKYEQARGDYEYLKRHHGGLDVYDITGGFVIDETALKLLEKPTKANAASIYIDLINYSFIKGFESPYDAYGRMPDLDDEKVVEIYERYGCL